MYGTLDKKYAHPSLAPSWYVMFIPVRGSGRRLSDVPQYGSTALTMNRLRGVLGRSILLAAHIGLRSLAQNYNMREYIHNMQTLSRPASPTHLDTF